MFAKHVTTLFADRFCTLICRSCPVERKTAFTRPNRVKTEKNGLSVNETVNTP